MDGKTNNSAKLAFLLPTLSCHKKGLIKNVSDIAILHIQLRPQKLSTQKTISKKLWSQFIEMACHLTTPFQHSPFHVFINMMQKKFYYFITKIQHFTDSDRQFVTIPFFLSSIKFNTTLHYYFGNEYLGWIKKIRFNCVVF